LDNLLSAERLLQKLIAESQTADSRNRLAATESIAGISLPLQIKQVSSDMAISAIRHKWEDHCRYKSQNQFPA
jgi:hypothetical protein